MAYAINVKKCTNQYHSKIKEKRNLRDRKRKHRDLIFKPICNKRTRTSKGFKSQNVQKRIKLSIY